ncbi:MAG: fimbrial assembly protein [Clostridiaceae bacterium]|nr:fimbrial assembly protein [Clostridiaceae bacterium]
MTPEKAAASVQPKLGTNLDTNFLKLIACLAMLIDHVGGALFPEVQAFRIIGRIAFPLFCYCMTVGLLYTHDIKRYLLRLGIFAIASQPFYILAFHPYDWRAELFNWNIFFTLFISLLAVWAFKERKWLIFAAAFFVICCWNFDYSANGIILMLIFYLCRNKPLLGLGLNVLFWLPCLFYGGELAIGTFSFDRQVFAALSLPFIYGHTNVCPKIPKYIFYAFYPAHLAAIAFIRLVILHR